MTAEQESYIYAETQKGIKASVIAEALGLTVSTVNGLRQRRGLKVGKEPPVIVGVTADDTIVDVAELKRRLSYVEKRADELIEKKASQTIKFPSLPVGIAVTSDLHIGGPAAYSQMFRDAELIRDSGLYCVCAGDMLNNWAVNAKLAKLQATEWLNQAEAQALYRNYLDTLGGKLVAVVAGNHDRWSGNVGADYVRDSLIGKPVLYDSGQVDFRIVADGFNTRVRLRHTFKGFSQYNPTHGIENSCRMDGDSFDIGITGHSHTASIARPFVIGEREHLALLVASYKILDSFASEVGFPKQHGTGSAAFVVDREGRLFGFGDIRQAADFLERIR